MKIPRKVLFFSVGAVLSGIAAKWPSLPLPSPEIVTTFVLALIGGHTATDIAAIIKGK